MRYLIEKSIPRNQFKTFSFTLSLLNRICSLKLCSFIKFINASVEKLLATVQQSSKGLLYDTGIVSRS